MTAPDFHKLECVVEYKISKLNSVDGLRYFIDTPKPGHIINSAQVKISGWAWCETGARPTFLVKTKLGTREVEVNVARADVSRHLEEKLGIEVNSDEHGFSTTVPFEDGMMIGFSLGKSPVWISMIGSVNKAAFTEYPTLAALTQSNEGVCKNVYFHNAADWSKVIVLFNGALTEAKIAAERAPFQRWSWAKRFKHPIFCVADPTTLGQDRLLLGWYLGDDGQNSLPDTLRPIVDRIKEINGQAEIIGFGSSGGGFAAIGATLLGYIDHGIAINPQTDALKFNVRSAVEAFQKRRKSTPCQSDLRKYDETLMRKNASVIYLQNEYDEHHFEEHYMPFRAFVEKSSRTEAFRFIQYRDKKSGHMPPDLDELCKLLGDEFTSLLKE